MTREKEIYKVTLAGGGVNVALLAFKFVAGILAGSAAMVADAVHSLSDFITDIIVIIFVRISSKPEDKDHDYGHGKYETLATTLIGLALLAVAVGIVYHGITAIIGALRGELLPRPGAIALWAALLSILLKEFTYRYTIVKARKLDSPALEANAWHHRSDALSSIGTAVGIGGAVLLGQRWTVLDPIASVIVGFFIVKVAFDLMREGVNELTESSLPDDVEEEIIRIVESFDDVAEPHHLRTRRIGSHYAIDMHVRMDGALPLEKAHRRATDIEDRLKERFGAGTFVMLHLEPFKDKQ